MEYHNKANLPIIIILVFIGLVILFPIVTVLNVIIDGITESWSDPLLVFFAKLVPWVVVFGIFIWVSRKFSGEA